MANQNLVQKLIESNTRLLIKMTGAFDGTGQETNVIKVDASSLYAALNANNMVMQSNTHPKSTYRLIPYRVFYNIGITGGYVKLHYDASSGDGTIALLSGSGTLCDDGSMVLHTNPLSANSNGDICLTTVGAGANSSYTVILDIKKDPRDYSNGSA